jgi:iron complex outermembrane receptor protein
MSLLRIEGGKGACVESRRWKLALLAGAAAALAPALALAQDTVSVDEVVVTAQRRAQNILDVPISITSYSTEAMDAQGIRQIGDVSRLTPSLRFTTTAGVSGNNGANIAIRGIFSDVGAATTAIYIDDTPVQIRSVGYFSGNPYPRVFDLERVEVLRGPQGTLFGAGAEGGAVRFITPQPTFGPMKVYGRSELATTKNGELSGEVGVAVGGAISDTFAFRASAWARRDGGYIDRVDPTTGAVFEKDTNWEETKSARLAVTWKPIESLSLTPSIYHQEVKSGGRNQFWESQSDVSSADYVSGPALPEPGVDKFTLSALKAEYEMGSVSLISNTSYFDRSEAKNLNYLAFQTFLRTGSEFGTYANKDPSNSNTAIDTKQKNFTQEVRLQSYPEGKPFGWTVGVYYSRAIQDFQNLTGSSRTPGVISSGFPQYLGRYNLFEVVEAKDKQIAGFASVDWKIVSQLKLTLGARYTHSKFNFTDTRDGPVNSGRRTIQTASQSENAFTPKIGLQYDFDEHTMLYASASKGFRAGGAQLPVDPGFCAADLATLGISASPLTFESDSLWSYELGSKGVTAGGVLQFDVNAYYVKWKNIQQSIRLPRCSFSYVDNLGEATSKGVDLQLALTPAPGVSVGLNIGYNHTSFDETIQGGNGLVLREEGDKIGGPAWTGSAFAEIERPLTDSVEGYARADYSFQSKGYDPNPRAFGFDPGLPGLPSSGNLNFRAGVRLGRVDVSAFVNNALNSHKALSRSNDGVGSLVYYVESYRPRTFGITGLYRY